MADYVRAMRKIEEIEQAVASLAPDELAQFRAWFEEFEAARFDEEVERDAAAGKLDSLADEAVREFRKRSRSPALTAQAAGSAA
jgi:hypothetical protein